MRKNDVLKEKQMTINQNVTLYRQKKPLPGIRIRNTMDAVRMLKHIREIDQETFWLICLNSDGQITDMSILSMGTPMSASISIRLLLKRAILNDAQSVIIAHNHPAGNHRVSREDRRTTRAVAKSCLRMACATAISGTSLSREARRQSSRWSGGALPAHGGYFKSPGQQNPTQL